MNGPSPVFALITDFGTADPYVGQMKAALLSRAPRTPIVDISHEVPPFSIPAGAFFLSTSRAFFPPGTIFIAVVDPGVGSERALLCVCGKKHTLLGPDNGLLSLAWRDMAREGRIAACRLNVPEHFARTTFHGRDVLAPAAARLAEGAALSALGSPWPEKPSLPAWAEAKSSSGGFDITILHIDRFGNCITNLPNAVPLSPGGVIFLTGNGGRRLPLAANYAGIAKGEPGILPGGQGYYEISCNAGSAAEALSLFPGDGGSIRPAREP